MLLPDPAYVAAVNAEIERRLAAAFEYLVCDVLELPAASGLGANAPCAHALQSLMRDAAVAGDVAEIRRLYLDHGEVLAGPAPSAPCRVVFWTPEDLSPSERFLLQAAFRDDIGLTARLAAPAPASDLRDTIAGLRAGIAQAAPLWAQEFEALVSMIVLAETEGSGGTFGGASAFAAWGAILVNPARQRDTLQLALTLIHESSHLKLFSAYLDDEIVLNDPAEAYSSPLRREPRPVNGIYHAAFVLARMTEFATDIQASGMAGALFGPDAIAELDKSIGLSIGQFEAAHDVIRAHGRLTPKGALIMAEAADGVAARKSARATA